MATILSLVEDKSLHRIPVPLDEGDCIYREIYGLPEFKKWLDEDLPKLSPGRLQASDTPAEQVDFRLYQWITGEEIQYSRHFKDLMPQADEVWELKMVDVRIFGWIYRPRVFIAVFGDYADLYKGKAKSKNYSDSIRKVKDARAQLDLDEPKYAGGTFDGLVCV